MADIFIMYVQLVLSAAQSECGTTHGHFHAGIITHNDSEFSVYYFHTLTCRGYFEVYHACDNLTDGKVVITKVGAL